MPERTRSGGPIVDAYVAAEEISRRWCRPFAANSIRAWQHKRLIAPLMVPNPKKPGQWKPRTDSHRRVLFYLDDLLGQAQRSFGTEPTRHQEDQCRA